MGSHQETNSNGLGELAFGMAPFLLAQHYEGLEAKMALGETRFTGARPSRFLGLGKGRGPATRVGKLMSTPQNELKYIYRLKGIGARGNLALSEKIAAGRIKDALSIAKHKGVFTQAAWTAAKNAKVLGPMAKIAASRAAGMFMLGFNISMFAPLIYSGVKGSVNSLREIGRNSARLEFGGNYTDTRGAYTERQRSLRAITSSRMSTRAAIGGEAALMHR